MKIFGTLLLMIQTVYAFANCNEGIESFKKTLHPILVQRCSNCHGDDGFVVKHSQMDAKKAYALAKKYVNFENVYASVFMTKVKSAHWINIDPNEPGMSAEEMEAGLKTWWESGEKLCPPALSTVSKSVHIPVNLPPRSSGDYTTLTWDLAKSSGLLKGCEFAVDIQRFSEGSGDVPGAFRLGKPRVKCLAGKRMSIQRVRFMLNGITNSYENIYENVEVSIIHDGTEKILSDELMIMIDQLTDTKELTVGFGEIKLEK